MPCTKSSLTITLNPSRRGGDVVAPKGREVRRTGSAQRVYPQSRCLARRGAHRRRCFRIKGACQRPARQKLHRGQIVCEKHQEHQRANRRFGRELRTKTTSGRVHGPRLGHIVQTGLDVGLVGLVSRVKFVWWERRLHHPTKQSHQEFCAHSYRRILDERVLQ